jgi:hypothetical protein
MAGVRQTRPDSTFLNPRVTASSQLLISVNVVVSSCTPKYVRVTREAKLWPISKRIDKHNQIQ